MKSVGVNTPPGIALPTLNEVATILAHAQEQQRLHREEDVQDRPRGLVAVSVDLRDPDPDHADERAADHRPHGHGERERARTGARAARIART